MSLMASSHASNPHWFETRSTLIAPLLLTLMVLLWGLSWPATAVALQSMSPIWLATVRFGSAAICLFAVVALRGKLKLPPLGDLPILFSVGLLQMLAFTGLGMFAMSLTDTSRAALLAYTTPLWAMIAAAILLRQKPTRRQSLALLVGLGGIALICSPLEMSWSDKEAVTASILLILGAIAYSLALVHIRQHKWTSSPLALAPWQMALATCGLAVFAFVFEGPIDTSGVDLDTMKLLVFIGPLATSVSFLIALDYGRKISSFAMSNLTLGIPVIGVFSSVALIGSRPSPIFYTGLLLVLGGMVLAAHATRHKRGK